MRGTVLLAGSVLVLAIAASGTTYTVNPDGTGDFPTIQAAVIGVVDGDIVELADGTFIGDGNRDVSYLGKAITIRSASGNPEACIIDCQGSETEPHRGFLFQVGEQSSSQLSGVTITGGWVTTFPQGGGVLCKAASSPRFTSCILCENRNSAVLSLDGCTPSFIDCVFLQNEGQSGGAIYCEFSSPTFSSCDFIENTAGSGGAFHGERSSALYDGCRFVQNTATGGGAIVHTYNCTPLMRNCLFLGNTATSGSGAVLAFCFAVPTFEGCTFAGNSAQADGAVSTGKMSRLYMDRCTFWGNDGGGSGGLSCDADTYGLVRNTVIAFSLQGVAVGGEGRLTLACCDVYGNPGGDWVGMIADQYGFRGNICQDPLFCDPDHGDFRVHCASPCAPFSPPNDPCDQIGAWPVGCGGSPAHGVTWGGMKALFRE